MTQATRDEPGGEHLYFVCKRVMDIVLTSVLLVILLPLLVVIVIAIKLDSPGSILVSQERVGARHRTINGQVHWSIRNFRVYKFRTASYAASFGSPGTAGTVPGADIHLTRVGRVLQRTHLDELPQLINVLSGNMSLVGPRPVPTYEAAEYQDWHRERLKAIPGMVGLWEVSPHASPSFDEHIRMDILYVRSQSLWLDLKILFLTITTALVGRKSH